MLYLRGHSLEYDRWAQLGCHGWSFEQVLPYFKRAETNARGANEWHGDSGPIVVKPWQLDLPICDAFLAAIAGLHRTPSPARHLRPGQTVHRASASIALPRGVMFPQSGQVNPVDAPIRPQLAPISRYCV